MSRPNDIPEDIWGRVGEIMAQSPHFIGGDNQAKFARAIVDERARCARIAEAHAGGTDYDLEPEAAVAESVTAKSIAAVIRSGGA